MPTLVTYWVLEEEGRSVGLPESSWRKVDAVLDAGLAGLERAARGGVRIVHGSDLLGGMHRHQSQEFRLRAEVQSPLEVLRGATGARRAGRPLRGPGPAVPMSAPRLVSAHRAVAGRREERNPPGRCPDGGGRPVVNTVTCIECGDELSPERIELGYRYCTRESCQARHHRGLAVTAVGVNKSAESYIVADPDEIRRRGEAGEFAKKDSALGLDYRPGVRRGGPTGASGTDRPDRGPTRSPGLPAQRRVPPPSGWSPEQEKIVRLYHDMGLSPARIAERARTNAPKLAITERLAVRILSARRPG